MRVQCNQAQFEQHFSGQTADEMYNALRAIYQYLPPGQDVESFSISIDVTMKTGAAS